MLTAYVLFSTVETGEDPLSDILGQSGRSTHTIYKWL